MVLLLCFLHCFGAAFKLLFGQIAVVVCVVFRLLWCCFCVAFSANCGCGLRNSKEMCNFVANLCVGTI